MILKAHEEIISDVKKEVLLQTDLLSGSVFTVQIDLALFLAGGFLV
jgi:mannose/fructose-specific phosphotransferase system component IIA